MSTFKDWLAVEQIGREVYLEAILEMEAQKSLIDLLEFYDLAVKGRFGLNESSEHEDDDDGPVELDDPFSGDEDAKPVEVAPEEESPERDPEEDDSQIDTAELQAEREAKKAKLARKVQQLAWAVRWSAMLDRRDAVGHIKKIYEDEWKPLVRESERGVAESFLHAVRSIGLDEQEAKKLAASKAGVSLYEAGKIIRRINESGWSVPKLKDRKSAATLEDRMRAVIAKAKPLLIKLGYVESGDLDGELQQTRDLFERAMKAAAAEQGNDPTKNKATDELARSATARSAKREKLQLALYKMLMKPAMRVDKADSRSIVDAETGKSKLASKYSQGPEDIVSGAMVVIMKKLTNRSVRKSDMSVGEWNSDLTVLTSDASEEPGKIINSIKSVVTRRTMYRDEDRGSKKAAGVKTNSKDAVTYLGGSGGKRDDGTMGDMDPTDLRTRDSLSTSAQGETASDMVQAFTQAMKDLKDVNPAQSILTCLWLSLDCAADGSIPTSNVRRLFSAARGGTMSSRKAPSSFIRELGLNQILPGKFKGRKGAGEWELVKLIKAKAVPMVGSIGGMPLGNLPEQAPNYANRMSFTPAEKAWYDYMKKVVHAKEMGIRFVTDKMTQIMAESDETQMPKGRESPCSWSITKFLNETFRDEIRSGGAKVEGRPPMMTVTFYNKNKKGREIRRYTITTDAQKINIVQKDWESDVFSYEMPRYTTRCPDCQGRGGNCTSCEGCGSTMDRVKTLALERGIHAALTRGRRKAKPRG